MPEQLTFDLPIREALEREAFFVSPSNAIALATMDQLEFWPNNKLVLVGPRGSGKTHMAHVWAQDRRAVIIGVDELGDADIAMLASLKHVVVENADQIVELPNARATEDALFHLHNLTLAEGGFLLITASLPPQMWKLSLPDLASRMQGTSVAKIDAPDDALLSAMLLKQFEDRQIAVSPTLIPYLVTRMERSTANLRQVVEALDDAALRDAKPISRSLAAHVLDTLGLIPADGP
ncbi:DnaA protein [Pacificibacter maritimus]|uniref:DnaA protein n=1 Tax=Pacificibacter maritimus TaxID=762213 RepID=A0A3N4UTK6_9RHOB|nr:DnaA/Hda family protein [Pacificibacter maritimus]RPE72035.1 DnaA protein [Pacificibacter maritimus]